MLKRFLAVIALVSAVSLTSQAFTGGKYYNQRRTIMESMPTSPTDIIMLGDSQMDIPELTELFADLRVKNRGISGDVTEGVIERLPAIIQGKPAKIFLRIGINDLSDNIAAETVAANILKIIDMLRQGTPDTKLYVETVWPINQKDGSYRSLDGKEADILKINSIVGPQAGAKGFTWLDTYSLLRNADGNLDMRYSNDGLHLMGSGYQAYRTFLQPYINE